MDTDIASKLSLYIESKKPLIPKGLKVCIWMSKIYYMNIYTTDYSKFITLLPLRLIKLMIKLHQRSFLYP